MLSALLFAVRAAKELRSASRLGQKNAKARTKARAKTLAWASMVRSRMCW